MSDLRAHIAQEAARIMCEQGLVDYHGAKRKAAQRLRCEDAAAMPSNRDVRDAVLAYQRTFGGERYRQLLVTLRTTALHAMRLLAEFRPRLVGAVADGAVHAGHRVQIHVYCDAPEMIDVLLIEHDIAFRCEERSYRRSRHGPRRSYPLLRFEAGEIGVDVTVFPEREHHHAPASPVDGAPMRRLDAEAVLRLLLEGEDAGR